MMIEEAKCSLFGIRYLLFKTSRNLKPLEDCAAPTFLIGPKLILDWTKVIH
jgi:hypothetical protein